jgi:aminoglycoside phosphotransferase (APT) family kinase protein
MTTRGTPDTARLAAWLWQRLSTDAGADIGEVAVEGLERAGVGQSSETLLFDAHWSAGSDRCTGEFVLRVQPPADGIFLHPDAVREFRVIKQVARHSSVPVPRVRWAEPDPAVLGAPFFVMDRATGTVPAGKPSIHAVGWLPILGPDERRRLAYAAIDCVAGIHAIDWPNTHRFLLREKDSRPDLRAHLMHSEKWHEWTTRGRSFPIVDKALAYLLENADVVAQGEPVLLWGDARMGNTMFSDDCTVSAVLDWEVASIGPAAVDIAHWLVFDEFATTAGGIEPLAGYPNRSAIITRYELSAGRTLGDLDYYETLQCFFLAVTLIRQADAAVAAGRLEPDTRMGHDNTVTQMLAKRLGLPIPELAPDYLRHRRPKPTAAEAI